MPTLLDISAVRKELNAGESTIRRWIKERRLPALRIGRRVLIRRDALDRFVRAAAESAKTAAGKNMTKD